ncbi:MAG: phosphosulfolactate synthase [Betaproteobacteria bacterium]|nr:phosphosulfolactate synthase [Betaproteobacteria bacterium]MDH3436548.1 phosphosulfolactate synthase [Betaproteobacteria bacterium]
MQERALHFVEMPEHSRKPRRAGLTLARDLGLGYDLAASWIEAVGEFIDYVKVRHLFVLLMRDEETDFTRRKIDLYRRHNIDVNPGGIVFEMAVLSNAVERTFATLAHLGFTAVELSENIIPLTLDDKVRYIQQARQAGLKVLFEVGEKYPSEIFDVERTADDIRVMLEAGCDLVIVEKSQLDLCLGSRAENPQAGKLAELAARVGLERVVFEAEATVHQAWLFRQFGPEVNIGPNIDIDLVCKLEATRRTLSREGGYGFLADKVSRAD